MCVGERERVRASEKSHPNRCASSVRRPYLSAVCQPFAPPRPSPPQPPPPLCIATVPSGSQSCKVHTLPARPSSKVIRFRFHLQRARQPLRPIASQASPPPPHRHGSSLCRHHLGSGRLRLRSRACSLGGHTKTLLVQCGSWILHVAYHPLPPSYTANHLRTTNTRSRLSGDPSTPTPPLRA